jgi:hypothetical protein
MGGTFGAYSTGLGHPMIAQVICQFGEVFLRHAENPMFGMHRGWYVVHVDPVKIQVIHDFPTSKTMTELQIFLGLTNFYCQFVLGLSHIYWALSQVIKSGVKAKFLWSAP